MLRFVLVTSLVACTAPATEWDVVYDSELGEAGLMDIYLPDERGPRPTVMFIHGGAWKGGSKEHFRVAGARLARSGYVAASINYRLLPAGRFPNNIADCFCALAFLREHAGEYGIDPDRIAVMGYSAGAHLASLVALASEHPSLRRECPFDANAPTAPPAAAISASGPQDMRRFYEENFDSSLVVEIFGGTPDEVPLAYDLGSPIFHVRPGAPPFLLMQDASDIGGIRAFRDAMVAAGNDAKLLDVEGSLHVFEQLDDAGFYEAGVASETPVAWVAIESFLARTIGGGR